MLKPKQKAYLRSLANQIKPVCQVGKEGLSENLLDTLLNYLNKHELMKVSMLKNTVVDDYEFIKFITDAEIEYVCKIGRVFVLYKYSMNAISPIVLPK